jgi:hypothetical protein
MTGPPARKAPARRAARPGRPRERRRFVNAVKTGNASGSVSAAAGTEAGDQVNGAGQDHRAEQIRQQGVPERGARIEPACRSVSETWNVMPTVNARQAKSSTGVGRTRPRTFSACCS